MSIGDFLLRALKEPGNTGLGDLETEEVLNGKFTVCPLPGMWLVYLLEYIGN